MVTVLVNLYNSVVGALQALWDWITTGIYDFMVWVFTAFFEWWLLKLIVFKTWAIAFAWDVAKQVLVDLGFSDRLNAAWGGLSSGVGGFLAALSFPQALTILVTALVTRLALRLIPGAL